MSAICEQRAGSVDAMRGFVMFFIIGLGSLLWHVGYLTDSPYWQEQMIHAKWEGLHLYDLIFPLFVYISGISMSFSLKKTSSKGHTLLRLWRRALVLIMLGWLVNGPIVWDLQQMRYASVLGLIGLSGALAGSLVLFVRNTWGQFVCILLLLVGIAAAQYWGGDMTSTGCVNAYIDSRYCPGQLYKKYYDPEGPLCILSATALNLLGYLSGSLFGSIPGAPKRLTIWLTAGTLLICAALPLPVIKNIWTPGFVLVTAGIGAILLAFFHLLCDVWKLPVWSAPMQAVGRNALFIYIVTAATGFSDFNVRLFAGTLRLILPSAYVSPALSATHLLLAWGICYFLHRRKLYIRV